MDTELSTVINVFVSDEWDLAVSDPSVGMYIKHYQLNDAMWQMSRVINEFMDKYVSPPSPQELSARFQLMVSHEVMEFIDVMNHVIDSDTYGSDGTNPSPDYMAYVNFVRDSPEYVNCATQLINYAFTVLLNSTLNVYYKYGFIGYITDVYETNFGYNLEFGFNAEEQL